MKKQEYFKKNIFKAPEGYFEALPLKIHQKLYQKKSYNALFKPSMFYWQAGFSFASVVGLVFFFSFFIEPNSNTQQTAASKAVKFSMEEASFALKESIEDEPDDELLVELLQQGNINFQTSTETLKPDILILPEQDLQLHSAVESYLLESSESDLVILE